jgi:hypothetical protein
MVLCWGGTVSHVVDRVVPLLKSPLVCKVVSVLNVPEVTIEEVGRGTGPASMSVIVEIPVVHVLIGLPFSELICVDRSAVAKILIAVDRRVGWIIAGSMAEGSAIRYNEVRCPRLVAGREMIEG